MAFKSFPKVIGSTDTEVFECPAATEAAVVLLVSNVSSSARTYTVKHYKASLDATLTVISTKSLAANTFEKVAAPISMEAGDKLIMSCSNANDIVVGGTITLSGTVQVISTFVSEGEWDSETTYTANVSIVSRSGNSYLARPNAEPNVDQDPATATDFWMLLAEKGETGDGDLSAANNLNDLADKPTAFANIKQAATEEASGVVELATSAEVAAGTDTARAVTPAGAAAVYSPITRRVNAQTGTTYTFVLGDAGIRCTFYNASPITVTVPPDWAVAFPNGTQIDVAQVGVGKVTLEPGLGVVINSVAGNKSLAAQYASATLLKTEAYTWLLFGSLTA